MFKFYLHIMKRKLKIRFHNNLLKDKNYTCVINSFRYRAFLIKSTDGEIFSGFCFTLAMSVAQNKIAKS
jgi:hypothetical protein